MEAGKAMAKEKKNH